MSEADAKAQESRPPDVFRHVLGGNLLALALLLVVGVASAYCRVRFPLLIGWLPSGVALSLILLLGPRILPGIWLGTTCALLPFEVPLLAALANGVTTVCASLAVWMLLAQRPDDFKELSVTGLARALTLGCGMFVIVVLVADSGSSFQLRKPAAAAVAAAPAHPAADHDRASAHGDHAARQQAATAKHTADVGQAAHPVSMDLFEWLLADAIGVLAVLPLVLHLKFWRRQTPPGANSRAMGWATLAVLLGTTAAIYSGFIEQKFGVVHTTLLVLPPAVWLALEYELSFTLLGNFAVWLIVGIGTTLGYGPFKDHSSGLPLLTAVYSLTTLMIAASSAERLSAHAHIYRLATRDPLTGLINRSTFLERVEQALSGARRYRRRIALMFIDLDNFKKVNDSLGHQVGDKLLIEAAQRILVCLRKDSTLGRFGGDEMVALVGDAENDQALAIVAERIATAMSMPFSIEGHECRISCSIGISRFPEEGESVSDLVRKADIAMYEVKAFGRNGYRIYEPGMHKFLDAHQR